MGPDRDVEAVLENYPRIFFACHRRHVHDAETKTTLSAHQASILSHLDEAEGLSLLDLARHMGVTASTMSLTIDRLERGGYVTRERSRQDKRRVELRLTRVGARIKGEEKVLESALVAMLLGRLEGAKRRQAVLGLELLGAAAREMVAAGEAKRYWKGEEK